MKDTANEGAIECPRGEYRPPIPPSRQLTMPPSMLADWPTAMDGDDHDDHDHDHDHNDHDHDHDGGRTSGDGGRLAMADGRGRRG